MATYSFKSVGQTQSDREDTSLAQTALPIGIKTPLRLGTNEGLLAMNYTMADQVHDNLRNLILTNWGERLGIYAFGANLRELTTEFVSSEDFDTRAIQRIRDAVSKWMPYVNLQFFSSDVDRINNKNTAIINITITYDVPTLGVKDKKLQVVLYVI